jgi:DNA-binding transcriptional MerR regulator
VSSLPPKLYFRIGEVAGLVGVEPHVLRYWEREFRSIRPTKSAKGQRVYSRRDVENLMRVRELLYAEGFTIAGAKKKLQKNGVEPELEARAASLSVGSASTATMQETQALAEEAPQASHVQAREPAPEVASPRVREALVELRGEIEAFLAELGGGG